MQEEVNVSTTGSPDNSESLDEQIDNILDDVPTKDGEPDNTSADTKTDVQDEDPPKDENVQDEDKYPEKFTNKDGSLNVQNLLKGYRQLEPLLNEKAAWEKDRQSFEQQAEYAKQLQAQQQSQAIQQGYSNPNELAVAIEVANAEANEYMKYLHLVGEPDKVRGLLALYAQSPSPELLERIEDEFGTDVVKHVSVYSDRVKNHILQRQEVQTNERITQEAKEFVENSIKDFPVWFEVPEFTNFFAEALSVKGDNFSTAEFVKHIENLKSYFRKEFESEQKANSENEIDKKSLKSLSPNVSAVIAPVRKPEDYTPEELDKAIGELV